MSYAETTFSDKNPIKRWLQQRRLSIAIGLCKQRSPSPKAICDFGAGNGELCKRLWGFYPRTPITCYEPTPNHLEEARENLKGIDNIRFYRTAQQFEAPAFDLVVCLEVLEHLPTDKITAALDTMSGALSPNGIIVIGVPVETGIPALYKGAFRMWRRYGAFDATLRNVALAVSGHPPRERPVDEIAPGFEYHWEHMGFESRQLENALCDYFNVQSAPASAWGFLKSWVMPEVYFVVDRAGGTLNRSY